MIDQLNEEAASSAPARTVVMEPITLDESNRLVELEKNIKDGLQTFIGVGNALAEIRDARLYRTDCTTFEKYCDQKWGFTKQHAYRLIKSAPIAKSNPQVTSLNQARALAKVPEEMRSTVIQAASAKAESAGRVLTAKDISETAAAPQSKEAKVAPKEIVAQIAGQVKKTKRQLDHWFWKATPQKRGEFLNSIFSFPVQVEDSAAFKKRVTQWLEQKVTEPKSSASVQPPSQPIVY